LYATAFSPSALMSRAPETDMREEFCIMFLDRKRALLKDEQQQRGTVDQISACTREVVKCALEFGAAR
jgi:DNA repair protein RadC